MAKRDQDVHFLASAAWEPICGKWLWMVTASDWICRM